MLDDPDEALRRVADAFTIDECPDMSIARIFGPSETREKFRKIGLVSLGNLLHLAGLRPDERVLDIGCGPGRVALPLTYYLSHRGSYVGMDPVADAIQWCDDEIAADHPNFSFLTVDWHNGMYNRTGTVNPDTYRFPFPDDSFDVVFMFSVFTHTRPSTTRNYLREIGRLLARGGRLLTTMFLVDDPTRATLEGAGAHRPFMLVEDDGGRFWTDHLMWPESAIAYDTRDLDEMLAAAGLTLAGPWVTGGWRNQQMGQDIVIARPLEGASPAEKPD